MAAVVTQVGRVRLDKNYMVFCTVAFDSSYPTGGESITPNALGFGTILMGGALGNYLGYGFQWDNANSKLLAYYSDYDAGADGPLIQVPDTTNLSTVAAIPCVFIGA